MPTRKPLDLHTRHATLAEKADRAEAEQSMRSDRPLSEYPPARLKDDDVAKATWRRMIREYGRVEAQIISRLDMDLLIDYCLGTSQLQEIDKMRNVAYAVWLDLAGEHERLKKVKADSMFIVAMALKVSGAFETITKLDARADQKRKMLLQMRQSLYLTPRARAGVAPGDKEKEVPKDPFEEALNKMTSPGRQGDEQ